MVISDFFNSLHDYLVPRGFISKQYSTSDTGIFNDFPLTELSHTFGIALTFIFFLLYGLRSVFMMKEIDSGMISKNHIVFPLGFLTICILCFYGGIIFNISISIHLYRLSFEWIDQMIYIS